MKILRQLLFITIMLFVGTNTTIMAQEDTESEPQKKFDASRLVFGGNIGASFNNRTGYAEVSPLVGYRFTNRFVAGLGPSYMYYKFAGYGTHIYGGRLFASYYLLNLIFVHGEYEMLNIDFGSIVGRKWIQRLPLGAGISQQLGPARVNFVALYDVLYNNNSSQFYATPWIFRGGVSFGW